MVHLELLVNFVIISLLAFGGGQAALPLVERIAVQQARWVSPSTFATAVAFGYITPGPVLITATFIGYNVAGLSGALVATLGAFVAPWFLAGVAAQQVGRFADHPVLRAFGAGAAPAVVGLLGITALSVAREAVGTSWPHLGIVAVVVALGMSTRLHPVLLLVAGGALGALAP